MRVLLSAIGSRGDVEPLIALACELKALDLEVRLCAPPDFSERIGSFGLSAVPIGPELRPLTAAPAAAGRAPPSAERLRQLAEQTLATQFATIADAARDCDVLVAAGALQIAAHSVAESVGVRYVYAGYSPVTLPSPHHGPPQLRARGPDPSEAAGDNVALWALDADRWNAMFAAALNTHRAAAGLPAVADVRAHIFTDRPWLAADATLAPWPGGDELEVLQTGAWILPDDRPLPAELEAFLGAGEPPIYAGFGSVRAPAGLSELVMHGARDLGRRLVLARGWAGLSPADDWPDCISVDEVNQQALFPRVAAVVHHGGAGTTTIAARAGTPQLVVPQLYDQHDWAARIEQLGIGTAHPPTAPTAESLGGCLSRTLQPDIASQARALAPAIRSDGAALAARQLLAFSDIS
jgi:vancomycin aglycone glucosyltransferase